MVDFTGVDGTMSLADVQKLPGNAPIGSDAFLELISGLEAVGPPGQSLYRQDPSEAQITIVVRSTASRRGLDVLDHIMAEYDYFFHSTRLPNMDARGTTNSLLREYRRKGKRPNPTIFL